MSQEEMDNELREHERARAEARAEVLAAYVYRFIDFCIIDWLCDLAGGGVT